MEIFGIHNQLTSACCSPPVPDAEHSCPVWHGMLREVSPPQGNYLDAFHPRKSSLLIPGGQLTLSPRSTELTSQWHVCCDQRQTHFRWILRRVVSSWHCTGRYFCDSQHLWWLGQVPVGLCNGGDYEWPGFLVIQNQHWPRERVPGKAVWQEYLLQIMHYTSLHVYVEGLGMSLHMRKKVFRWFSPPLWIHRTTVTYVTSFGY